MRIKFFLPFLVTICAFSGCVIPTKEYVKQHPELTPEHRKIILSGRIKFGDPVAGMTREQVRLVMGTDPDQFDSVNGEDTWTWFHSKAGRTSLATDADNGGPARMGGGGPRHREDEDAAPAADGKPPSRTTVFFKGDIATHVAFGNSAL